MDGLLKGLAKTREETKGAAGALSGFASVVMNLGGIAAGVGAVFKTAFDFGNAGAQIGQVESAFDSLISTLGAAPDTLNQMQSATRNTVSELDLMSSSTTFLKGATGEMGAAFAGALPELASIAQAAHDLNPTMGTTAEMFDRLTRGVRKAEPELLDEMGLIFRLDNVYRDYAATLGKTADQLTVEEKSMATLNEVLRQGDGLIEQAAGVNVKASDSFAELAANTTDLGNNIKESLAPGLSQAANAANIMFFGTEKLGDALAQHAQQVFNAGMSYSDYEAELRRAASSANMTIDIYGNLRGTMGNIVQENYLMSAAQWASAKSAEGLANATSQLSGGLSMLDNRAAGVNNSISSLSGGLSRLGEGPLPDVNDKLEQQAQQVGASQEAWDAYGARLTAAAEAAGMTALTMDQLQIMSVALAAGLEGTLGSAMDGYTAGMQELQAQQAAIIEQMGELEARGATNSEQYAQLTEALNQNKLAQEGALASLQQLTAETIYQQAAVGLDTQAALDLARSMGVLSEADYATATAVATLRNEFDQNADGMISAAEGASKYAAGVDLINRAVASLQAKNMPVTLDNIQKEMSELAKTDASTEVSATASAADEGTGELEGFGDAASTAAGGTGTLAGSSEDVSEALKAIAGAAGGAASGISTIRGSAEKATGPLSAAASAAGRLAANMRDIPRGVSVSASASGFEKAIEWVNKLTNALNNIPNSVSATINLSTSGSGGTGGGGGGGTPRVGGSPTLSAPTTAAPALSITNNIYDPLAGAIAMDQQAAQIDKTLNGLMA